MSSLSIFTVSAVAQTQIPCARPFTVRPGDTCDGISAEQGVSSFQEQVICLQRVCLGCNDVHVVVDGNTLPSIADRAGISVATLIANNPNLGPDCNLLFPGEVLCVGESL
ncbi:hypothetical protein BDN71DRAFT_982189 [Pleurotus eryngii]|uniref:LysM domain-containing protein n=1 Tax=Pleurotus eryngii TaxID=5323 RepID=A0A9P5ZWK8_PLEER|nr:hypothetical protein BDN71DRAFT_982189 [Pleurotus eryngii]